MMRRTSVIAIIAMVVGLLAAAPASHATPVPCGAQVRGMLRNQTAPMETIVVRSFNVEMKVDRPVWKVGETVIIHTTVTRPAHEDPAGQHIEIDPPTTQPATNVNMGIGVRIGDVFLFGSGITDDQGKIDIKVKLKPYTTPGSASVDGYAWNRIATTPCLNIEENGYTHIDGLFKVIK